MSKGKLLFAFLLAFFVAVPSYAVELSLGGFPSFMRTRLRVIKDGTFIGALTNEHARALGFSNADDEVIFADTRLRLTPQLILSDNVTIRAQIDVADNNIWGGANSILLRDVVFEALTPNDRFRGALIVGGIDNVLFRGLGTNIAPFDFNGAVTNVPIDDVQYFNVRMIHMDIVLPNNLGFIRVGRQPFDWGLGILANGGWDPHSDLGFVLDRFLYLKSWGIGDGNFTFVFVTDRFRQGTTLVTGGGDAYDIGAVALIYNTGGLTVGGYLFPYIHQNNFAGLPFDATFLLWAAVIDYKTDMFRLVGEVQNAVGEIEVPGRDVDIEATNLLFVVRAEVYPGFPVNMVAVEFGYAGGDEISTTDGGDFQGNVLAFSAAYNIDQLLFKHMIPSIYGIENSVINAYYARAWGTIKLLDRLSFTPHVLFAWNQEREALVAGAKVGRYLATELEGTFTINIVPGVDFDIIGSVVIPGDGLDDLITQRAGLVLDAGNVAHGPDDISPPDVPFAVQGRLLIYIDQFFK
ncbi:MAG: hypothetical protein IH874_03600 [Candidatus Dadabacteria bacterium]|nr:hypothetical protein [Candidatus Dadabacteria bacterium]